MQLTFYGAAKTVTGSQHMIEVNGLRILLDCGLYQGKRAESYERNLRFPFDPQTVDVMVLSHAHIDHSGNIPNLVKSGFNGDILCTHATRDLAGAMLLDSGHIQERDVEFVNKQHKKKGEPPVEPLYTQVDATACMEYFITQGYNRARAIAPGVTLTLLDAGHMLGSAIVVLDIEDKDAGKAMRLVFSGDLGRKGLPILRDPQRVDAADILILESTYGDRLHPPYEDENRRLEQIIHDTYKRGGSIIVPAFAVGRTQQIVYTLHQLVNKGDIPQMPVFVDSPLAIDATAIFRLHPECYDEETRAFMFDGDGKRDPFGFNLLSYTRSTDESKKLNFIREPMIVISASGMAETGRILHHLKNRLEDPKTTILIVGWCAPDTLGRKLVDGEKRVSIFGEIYDNNAHVEVMTGFSGHADCDELCAWVGAMSRKPARTFLVHGEEPAQAALAGALKARFGLRVDIPDWKQRFDL